MGGKIKINCYLNKIILPINPSLKILPFFPFPPSSSSPSCPRSRFVRLRTCDSVRGLRPKIMCLITGHFAAERPRIWIHPSSYALVASRCRWLRQALHRDAKGYAGLGRATFVSALGKVQTTLCVALALTHGDVRLVVALLWADGRRSTFALRILNQCLGCAYKKEPEPSGIRDSPGCFRRFLSAENLLCRDCDGGWKEQGRAGTMGALLSVQFSC